HGDRTTARVGVNRSGDSSREEASDGLDDVSLLLFGQLREHRERERLVGGGLGAGEVALAVAEVGEALLEVHRHGVVDLRADAARLEVLDERVAARRRGDAYDVEVEYV